MKSKQRGWLAIVCLTIFAFVFFGGDCLGFNISDVVSKMAGQKSSGSSEKNDSDNEDDGEFNFIKTTGNSENDFFSSDKVLLYSGIALVTISVLGMILTVVPIRGKNKKYKKRKIN